MFEFNTGLRRSRGLGLAGAILIVSAYAAQSQEAAPAPTETGCSGLLCVFSTPRPAPAPVAPAPQPAAANEDTIAPPASVAAEPIRPKPKPARLLTISADAAQAPRLHMLAASMPKERIKLVPSGAPTADFAVATAFAPHEGAETVKLFTEALHVVAGGRAHALADLRGKVVSFGADGSASQAAGRRAFQTLGIEVHETPLEVDNALDGLSTGDIDAVVILAPQPIDRLKTMTAPGLHLLAWPDGGALPNGAVSASIDGAVYPGLAKPDEHIAALGVDAVLTVSPKAARLPAAKTFLAALAQHSATLSKHGFDLLKADLDSRADRRVASVERR